MQAFDNLVRKTVIVLFSAFFFSCENETSIGLDFFPQDATFTDTISLKSSTYLMDSVITSNQNFGLVGKAIDPQFGTVTSALYLQPALLTNTSTGEKIPFDIEDAIFPDSLVLRLWNRSLISYGDSTASVTINVHRLTETFQNKNYSNKDELSYDPMPIETVTLNLEDLREVNDSTSSVLPIDIKLPNELLDQLAALEGTEEVQDQVSFNNIYKGFVLVPESTSETVMTFNLGASDRTLSSPPPVSSLIFYWHFEGNTTASLYEFEFADARFHSIKVDRSNTEIAVLTNTTDELESEETDGKLWVQASTGIVPRITFPGIDPLRNRANIAKADITFEVDTTFFSDKFDPAPLLVPIELNPDGSTRRDNVFGYSYVNNSLNSITGSLGIYNDSLNTISLDITAYVRDLVLRNSQDVGLIFPSASTTPGSSDLSSGIMFNAGLNRSVLKNPKLEVYFSE